MIPKSFGDKSNFFGSFFFFNFIDFLKNLNLIFSIINFWDSFFMNDLFSNELLLKNILYEEELNHAITFLSMLKDFYL